MDIDVQVGVGAVVVGAAGVGGEWKRRSRSWKAKGL